MCEQIICRICGCNLPSRKAYTPCPKRDRSGHVPVGERRCPDLNRRVASFYGPESRLKCAYCEVQRKIHREQSNQLQQAAPSAQPAYLPEQPSPSLQPVCDPSQSPPLMQSVLPPPPPPSPYVQPPTPTGRYTHQDTGPDEEKAESIRPIHEASGVALKDLPLGSCERILYEMLMKHRELLEDSGAVKHDSTSGPPNESQPQDNSQRSQDTSSNQIGSLAEPASGYDFSS